MKYIEAPATHRPDRSVSVFLAGGIGNCPDWQQLAVQMFAHLDEVTVLNPRRASFPKPWTYDSSVEQITWEYHALAMADIVLFWFPGGESVTPIALYELGSHARDFGKRLAVGVDPGYPRTDDVHIQLGLLRGPYFPIHYTLDQTCADVEHQISGIQRARGY